MEDLLAEIRKTGIQRVAVTGGEPFLNRDLPKLLEKLLEEGYKVKIETNGTNYLEDYKESRNITVVCSPKPDDYYVDPNILKIADELKFVIDDTIVLGIIQQEKFADKLKKVPLILQPESNKQEMIAKAIAFQKELLKSGIEARVIPQVHKFMNIP